MTPRDRLQRLLFEHRTHHDPASSEREILRMFDDLESATHDLTIAYMSGRYDGQTGHEGASVKYIPLTPFRQTWLTPDLLHSASSARLCTINGKQFAQLDHPNGGPLTCVQNRTGHTASGVERVDGKWCWVFEPKEDHPND